jgi:LPS-assembly protein
MAAAIALVLAGCAIDAARAQEAQEPPLLLRLDTQRMAPLPRGDAGNKLPVILRGDEIRGQPDIETVVDGDAEFRRGGLVIRADRLSYDNAQDLAQAHGHVKISHAGNTYEGPELQLRVQRFEGFFLQPTYFFSTLGAGGHADRVDFIDDQRALAINATYSSCPRDDGKEPDWILTSKRVRVDFEANTGEAEGAVLRFLGVPILAAPVLSFPLTDERKSGMLPPSFALDSRSGLIVAEPYYWNIAPQRDATFTPLISSKRGVGLNTEVRYLEPQFQGLGELDLLPHDRVAGHSRHALSFLHESLDTGDLHYHLQGERVSDDDYWKDFPHAVPSLEPRLLAMDLEVDRKLHFGDTDWTAYGRILQWQILQDPEAPIDSPYQRSPQVGLRSDGRLLGGVQWNAETEYNRFTLVDKPGTTQTPTGERVHLLASVSRPFGNVGWLVTPKLILNAASYATDQPMSDGRTQASRAIPTFSLDSAWVLERDTQWFGKAVRQTLEPRLMYVNTPFVAQSTLPLFDTSPKDFNFDSIFTENPFNGIDRVADGHQLTAGVTTRFLDPQTGAETLRLGAVQRFLLRNEQITPEGQPTTQRVSDVLLLGSTTLVPSWTLDGTMQYSPDIERVERSVVAVRYSPGPFRTASLTYRLARGSSETVELGWQWPLYRSAGSAAATPTASTLPEAPTGDRVSRAMSGAFSGNSGGSCSGTWYGVGRVNYSLRDSRVTDSIVGVEYDAGCWIARVVGERLSTGTSEATTRLLLQLELVGLSRLGSNPLGVLKDNIPGYRLLREDRGGPFSPASYSSSYD